MTLEPCLNTPLSWARTGQGEFPYAAGNWLIRINDFPAEPMYTLLVDNREIGDFDDWPPCWIKP